MIRARVIHSAVQPSCAPRGSFGAAIEWPELGSRVARGRAAAAARRAARACACSIVSQRATCVFVVPCAQRGMCLLDGCCTAWVRAPGVQRHFRAEIFQAARCNAAQSSLCYVYNRNVAWTPRSSGCGGRAAGGVRELGAFDDRLILRCARLAARSERAETNRTRASERCPASS